MTGLEPARSYRTQAPQACVSTNFTTCALGYANLKKNPP